MKAVFLLFAAVGLAWAQSDSPNMTASLGNPDIAYTVLPHYTTGVLDYLCKARSTQDVSTTINISAVTNANPGVATATAHGFFVNGTVSQHFVVFISGFTGNWTPLNGWHVLSAAGANTLTTDVNTTTFGALTGTPVVSTRAPRATAAVWAVQQFGSDSNGNLIQSTWAVPVPASTATIDKLQGGITAFVFTCAAPTAYQ